MKKIVKLPASLLAMAVIIMIVVHGCKKDETDPSAIKDGDGNTYTSVSIGSQIWLKENLKTTKFNDGTQIPLVTALEDWRELTSPGCCWYDNNAASYKNSYGALYNWFAASSGKLCPTGWHVPSHDEWETLVNNLGSNTAGGQLKEMGTTHWLSPNEGASNSTGFTALPGGQRAKYGSYSNMGSTGYWWTSTQYSSSNAHYHIIYHNYAYADDCDWDKEYGLSVRCIKD